MLLPAADAAAAYSLVYGAIIGHMLWPSMAVTES